MRSCQFSLGPKFCIMTHTRINNCSPNIIEWLNDDLFPLPWLDTTPCTEWLPGHALWVLVLLSGSTWGHIPWRCSTHMAILESSELQESQCWRLGVQKSPHIEYMLPSKWSQMVRNFFNMMPFQIIRIQLLSCPYFLEHIHACVCFLKHILNAVNAKIGSFRERLPSSPKGITCTDQRNTKTEPDLSGFISLWGHKKSQSPEPFPYIYVTKPIYFSAALFWQLTFTPVSPYIISWHLQNSQVTCLI